MKLYSKYSGLWLVTSPHMRRADSYIFRRTSLGAIDPTLMNPFFIRNFFTSPIGVCFNNCVFVVILLRIVRFDTKTETFGKTFDRPVLYVRRTVRFCLFGIGFPAFISFIRSVICLM